MGPSDQAIDRPTYDRELAELDEALTFGQLELRDAELEDFDMEAALGFARHLLSRAYKLWDTATSEQKRRLQPLIFPEGVTFDGEALGTPVTSLLFSYLGTIETGGEGLVAQGKMVSNTGTAGFIRLEKFLRRLDTFRRSEFAA